MKQYQVPAIFYSVINTDDVIRTSLTYDQLTFQDYSDSGIDFSILS